MAWPAAADLARQLNERRLRPLDYYLARRMDALLHTHKGPHLSLSKSQSEIETA